MGTAANGFEEMNTHTESKENRVEIVDIGSGYAGMSRLLPQLYHNVHVTAIEIQKEVSNTAERISCLLRSKNVTHMNLSINDTDKILKTRTMIGKRLGEEELDVNIEDEANLFDCACCVLVILHILDRSTCLQNVSMLLKSGGLFYIEDFYENEENRLTDVDKQNLKGMT